MLMNVNLTLALRLPYADGFRGLLAEMISVSLNLLETPE